MLIPICWAPWTERLIFSFLFLLSFSLQTKCHLALKVHLNGANERVDIGVFISWRFSLSRLWFFKPRKRREKTRLGSRASFLHLVRRLTQLGGRKLLGHYHHHHCYYYHGLGSREGLVIDQKASVIRPKNKKTWQRDTPTDWHKLDHPLDDHPRWNLHFILTLLCSRVSNHKSVSPARGPGRRQ